mmetsp:Transcript_20252/g.56223  ORF Transcript_20252/g.56223 Transcript_20252/m.56223 type:complete len:694 (+) Transcript_20252:126-2207(+)
MQLADSGGGAGGSATASSATAAYCDVSESSGGTWGTSTSNVTVAPTDEEERLGRGQEDRRKTARGRASDSSGEAAGRRRPEPPNMSRTPTAAVSATPGQEPWAVDVAPAPDNSGNSVAGSWWHRVAPQHRHKVYVQIESASGLHRGMSPGSFEPYCICEIPGKPRSRVMTRVACNSGDPIWNFHAEVPDCATGDLLEFSVFGRDQWPKTDEFLGKAVLDSNEILPNGFVGDVPLQTALASAPSAGQPQLRIRVSLHSVGSGANSVPSVSSCGAPSGAVCVAVAGDGSKQCTPTSRSDMQRDRASTCDSEFGLSDRQIQSLNTTPSQKLDRHRINTVADMLRGSMVNSINESEAVECVRRHSIEEEIALLRANLARAEQRWHLEEQRQCDEGHHSPVGSIASGGPDVMPLPTTSARSSQDERCSADWGAPRAAVAASPGEAEPPLNHGAEEKGSDSQAAEGFPAEEDIEDSVEAVGVAEEDVNPDLAAHLQDGAVLFEILDRDQDGKLGPRDARAWLRSLGWCLDSASINSMLKEVHEEQAAVPEGGAQGARSGTPSSPREQWTFPQLLTVADRHRDMCGPDPEAIRKSLQVLAGGRNWRGSESNLVSKELLRSRATCFETEGGLSAGDFDELLALCGVSTKAKMIPVDAVVSQIVDTICHPKATAVSRGHGGCATRAGGVRAATATWGSSRPS